MTREFASTADLAPKQETLHELARGVWAMSAEGDPNVGAIEGEDFVVCFDARATPSAARRWLEVLREHTDKPVRYLVLSHYHAVRVLGAAAFEPQTILAHQKTRHLISERGQADWDSEHGRMPRLFPDAQEIPGLTWPDLVFERELRIPLGGERGDLVLMWLGGGHTAGDIVAWVERDRVLFAGDLVEAEAALYTGDAFHKAWATGTLDAVAALEAESLVGGRGPAVEGRAAVDAAIAGTRGFLDVMRREVGRVHGAGGTMRQGFEAAHAALAPAFGHWPIFEHCMPFNVARLWDELAGITWPRIWTAERDRQVWAEIHGP